MISNHKNDTIYALASARGQAGIAVIRVSGLQAFSSLEILSGQDNIESRVATLCNIKRSVSRETLDQAIILAFKAPNSYTGEDIVEYHVHGGIAVVNDILDELAQQKNHRMAEPGEFTRRAFENGKMDLTKAEAVADLIHAETTLQKQQALLQMGGALADIYEKWRKDLIKILAYVEAEIEFPDEDLPVDIFAQIKPQLEDLIIEIDAHLNDNRRGERLRDGIHVAIIGAPNAGKSSLVNALAQRDIAIVSEIAGTTRDIIEAHLDIGGYPVIISDTAGLRPDQVVLSESEEHHQASIETEGIRRALKIAQEADIRIILYDGTAQSLDEHSYALEHYDNTLIFINKVDQPVLLKHPANPVGISVAKNIGIKELLDQLTNMIENLLDKSNESPAITRRRHRESLNACKHALERSFKAPLPELLAEDLRLAIRDLGRITGKVDVEDLLDVVFRDFCIGK